MFWLIVAFLSVCYYAVVIAGFALIARKPALNQVKDQVYGACLVGVAAVTLECVATEFVRLKIKHGGMWLLAPALRAPPSITRKRPQGGELAGSVAPVADREIVVTVFAHNPKP